MTQNALDSQRALIVEAALPHVIFDGWSQTALTRAAEEQGVEPVLLQRLFPHGPIYAIAFHSHQADQKMVEALQDDAEFQALPVPLKVKAAMLTRFDQAMGQKEAVRKGLSFLALPQNSVKAMQLLHDTSNTIWQLAGDRSTDFNWYSKRLTLSGVYSASLLYWLNDESDSLDEVAAFIDRRLEGVKRIGKLKQNVKQWLPQWPKPKMKHGSA